MSRRTDEWIADGQTDKWVGKWIIYRQMDGWAGGWIDDDEG